jgi:hypothetical protein
MRERFLFIDTISQVVFRITGGGVYDPSGPVSAILVGECSAGSVLWTPGVGVAN